MAESIMLRQLTWRHAVLVRDAAEDRVDFSKHQLEMTRQRIEQDVQATECTAIPPAGTLVYIVNPNIMDCIFSTSSRGLLDPSGRMLLAVVDKPYQGRAIRFRVDADGPVMVVRHSQRDDERIENMIPAIDNDNAAPAPLYRAGDILEFRKDATPPDDSAMAIGQTITLDQHDFMSISAASLRVIKEGFDDTRVPLPKNAIYMENAIDYAILDSYGFPRRRYDQRFKSLSIERTILEPISGQIVSIMPYARVITRLSPGWETKSLDSLKNSTYTMFASTTASELAVPMELQVKSAARRQ